MTNLARSSLALLLAALAGAAKSCALANIFMISPDGRLVANRRRSFMSLITAISWQVVYPNMLHIDDKARVPTAPWGAGGRGWWDCIEKRSTLGRPPVKQ